MNGPTGAPSNQPTTAKIEDVWISDGQNMRHTETGEVLSVEALRERLRQKWIAEPSSRLSK